MVVAAAGNNDRKGLGGAPGREEERGESLGLGERLTSPGIEKHGGGADELRRALPAAWRRVFEGKERGKVRPVLGYL